MKKAITILVYILFALIVFHPLVTILFSLFGYTFELTSYSLFSVITALLAVRIVVLSVKAKESINNKVVTVLLALITPLSLINAFLNIMFCNSSLIESTLVATSMCICCCCCCYLTIRHGKPLAIKIICLLLSALMALPVGFFGLFAIVFADFGRETVVQSVESPDGKYYSEVIYADEGALGGSTIVNVYKSKSIFGLFFKIYKEVYFGDCDYMSIYWKDDHHIVVNSREYSIP